MVADAVHKAMDVEAMKKHLLLVGAIKDEDIRQAGLERDISPGVQRITPGVFEPAPGRATGHSRDGSRRSAQGHGC